jgi:hypothetical protein
MDQPGPVICMYVCVGTVSHALGPTDPLVVAVRGPIERACRIVRRERTRCARSERPSVRARSIGRECVICRTHTRSARVLAAGRASTGGSKARASGTTVASRTTSRRISTTRASPMSTRHPFWATSPRSGWQLRPRTSRAQPLAVGPSFCTLRRTAPTRPPRPRSGTRTSALASPRHARPTTTTPRRASTS